MCVEDRFFLSGVFVSFWVLLWTSRFMVMKPLVLEKGISHSMLLRNVQLISHNTRIKCGSMWEHMLLGGKIYIKSAIHRIQNFHNVSDIFKKNIRPCEF